MEFVIVSDEDLTRISGRVVAAIRGMHPAEVWNVGRYLRNPRYPLERGGVIVLGDNLVSRRLVADIPPTYERFGIQWGFAGPQAYLRVLPAPATPEVLDGTELELQRLQAIGADALIRYDQGSSGWGGAQFAGTYLDPGRLVQETVLDAAAPFSLSRLLWERQVHIGVGAFFLQGFDRFAAGL